MKDCSAFNKFFKVLYGWYIKYVCVVGRGEDGDRKSGRPLRILPLSI